MSKKERVLAEMDAMGIGYCSPKACEIDEMGVGITWEEILHVPLSDLIDMRDYFKEKKWRNTSQT